FDVITSLSVIEHGVNHEKYFKEMYRILKPDGLLLTSTDYWPYKINVNSQVYRGGHDMIFSKQDIYKLLDTAASQGFALTEPIDFTVKDKVVYWKPTDSHYTFIFLL
ncbi:MAG: methyltransferase domain-containing protein, partial [Nitrososphaera sp.]